MSDSGFDGAPRWILTAGEQYIEILGGRAGLRDPEISELLGKARSWECGCGGGLLTPRRVTRGLMVGQSEWRTVVALTRHPMGCPANVQDEPPLFSGRIFHAAGDGATTPAAVRDVEPSTSARRVLSFDDLASGAISRASLRAFVARNAALPKSEWTLPSESEILAAVGTVLSTANFARHEGAFATARANRCQIIWGITDSKLANAFDRERLQPWGSCRFAVREHWSETGRNAGPVNVTIPAPVAFAHGGKTRIFGATIPPPYFFLLVLDSTGRAVRLYLQPIERRRGSFTTIESRLEGRWWGQEIEKGRIVVKIQRLVDLEILPDEMFCDRDGRRIILPHRADFIRWIGSEIHIIETAGLSSAEYLENLSQKEQAYRAMEARHAGVHYGRVTEENGTFVEWLADGMPASALT